MARVNLDGKVWKDPRVKRLARLLGWHMRETVGALAAVWDVAYDNRTPEMTALDVDTAADHEGFADRMLAVELADPGPLLRLHGVTERISFLLTQAERGRLGGLAKSANSRARSSERLADAKPVLSERLATPYQSSSLPLAPDLPPSHAPTLGLDLDSSGDGGFFDFGTPPPSPPAPATPKGKPRSKATQLPPDWQPAPYAIPRGVDVARELQRFRDHALGKGRTQVDWQAAWRNWLLKAEEYAGARAPKTDALSVFLGIAQEGT